MKFIEELDPLGLPFETCLILSQPLSITCLCSWHLRGGGRSQASGQRSETDNNTSVSSPFRMAKDNVSELSGGLPAL